MTYNKSRLILSLIAGAMIATALGLAHVAGANPLRFPPTSKSAAATTTLSYLTAGTATTTHQYDSYQITSLSNPSAFALDRALLLIRLSASSTPATLRAYIEYSQDGIDWYQDGGTNADGFATTTKPIDISQPAAYDLRFASTTAGHGLPGATSATTTRAILVKTYSRFVRAVFTVPAGSQPVNVWSEWVPVRQASE